MADNEKSGAKSALAELASGEPPNADGVQLTLDALLPKPHPEGEEGEVLDECPDATVTRAVGRPPGSTNIATREWSEFLDRQYTNPLVTLSKVAHIDPFELVRTVCKEFPDISQERVLSFWKECALSIMPYRAKKQPVAVDITGKGSFSLILEDPAPEGRSDDEAGVLKALLACEIDGEAVEVETAENSQIIEGEADKSDGEQSDTPRKAPENSEK